MAVPNNAVINLLISRHCICKATWERCVLRTCILKKHAVHNVSSRYLLPKPEGPSSTSNSPWFRDACQEKLVVMETVQPCSPCQRGACWRGSKGKKSAAKSVPECPTMAKERGAFCRNGGNQNPIGSPHIDSVISNHTA